MTEPWPYAHRTYEVKKAEMYETDPWAVEAILDVEFMTPRVIDPCVGRGIMADMAVQRGHQVHAIDLYDWGYQPSGGATYSKGFDWLNYRVADVIGAGDWTCFMNPPFKRTCEFVDHAFDQGARKVVMFQRLSFYESGGRSEFFKRRPPSRVYVCGDRATCWRLDISPAERKKRSGSPTAHAWFIFEAGDQPAGTLLGRLEKPGK